MYVCEWIWILMNVVKIVIPHALPKLSSNLLMEIIFTTLLWNWNMADGQHTVNVIPTGYLSEGNAVFPNTVSQIKYFWEQNLCTKYVTVIREII